MDAARSAFHVDVACKRSSDVMRLSSALLAVANLVDASALPTERAPCLSDDTIDTGIAKSFFKVSESHGFDGRLFDEVE
jgi:hypothetical protein